MQIKPIKNRIIFMGTPKIAAACLAAILQRPDIEVIAVVTQPDKPVGRKKILTPSEVKQFALQHNIKVLQDAKVGNLYEEIKQLNPDLIFTCAFGQFVPTSILNIPKYKCVNLHASLLPKLRGGAPIQWAIINGDEKTGFSLMYMDKTMDSGNIIKQYEMRIEPRETYSSLYNKLCVLAQDIIIKDFGLLFNENLSSVKQDESLVTFGYNITRDDEKISWDKTAKQIDLQVRGLYSNPIAYTMYSGQIIKVHQASVKDVYANIFPGGIVSISKDGITVQTKDKAICFEVIQLPGKKPCHVNQIINGNHPFKVGTKFE